MAMLQSLFLGIIMFFQSFLMPLISPDIPLAYGGNPYTPPVITAWLPIVEDGETDYVIAKKSGEPSIDSGVKWLVSFVEEMTGVKLGVIDAASADINDKLIIVGDLALAGGALDSEAAQLTDEGFVKKVVDDDIFIYGIGRGTMYGCADFIEQQLGCRWYTPSFKVIPKKADAAIDKNLCDVQNTTLEYRNVFWAVIDRDPEFMAFHKLNSGVHVRLGEQYGWGVQYMDFCHTMERLVPASLFAEHPEYFSWRADANVWDTQQRCLTNPDVLALTKQNVFALIDSNISNPDYKIVSVTQNDNGGVCQCANCLAMDAKYGGPSGTNIWFVNQIADAVKAKYPGRELWIDTFAYDYTTPPPTVLVPGENVPRDNVIVRLCSIGCCFTHPIEDCGHGRSEGMFERFKAVPNNFADYIKGWSEICEDTGAKLYIWDYTTNFKFFAMPFPNLQVLSANINFFIDHNVYGIFEQGNTSGPNGEFAELRAYLLAKLLWSPKADAEYIINEFMAAYYGEGAAPFIKEYLDATAEKAMNTGHLHIFNRPDGNTYFSPSDLRAYDKLFDSAEAAAAGDPFRLDNVRRSRLSLRCYKANMLMGEFSPLNLKRLEESKKLFHDMVMLGITQMEEGTPISEPYSTYVWLHRPWDWADMDAWLDFPDESKIVPLDIEDYKAKHQ